MIYFFKMKRWFSMKNHEYFKYTKYVVGEIFIVIVGILIALYINNWNEERKEQEEFNMVLVEVEKELIDNISFARSTIHKFAQYDSLCLKFFIDSVRFDDSDKYRPLLRGSFKSTLQDDSFQKLIQLNDLSEEQESILDELIDFNREGRVYIDDYSRKIIELVDSRFEAFKKYDWYENWVFRQHDDRISEFFTNDLEGRKVVLENFSWVSEYRYSLADYDNRAISVYETIYKYLDSLNIEDSDSLLFQYDPKDYKRYLGKYHATWCSDKDYVFDDSTIVSIEQGKLMWTSYRPTGPDNRYEIIPINNYHFRDEHSYLVYHLQFDEQGEVTGIRLTAGPTFILTMNKIP